MPSSTYVDGALCDTLPIVQRSPGFHRILFAVNGSEHSEATVPIVAAIAHKSHADVLVSHVWNPNDVRLGHDDLLSCRRNEETCVDAVVERLSAAGVSAAGESVGKTNESVAAFIVSRAASYHADLIAIGNRGLSELHSFLVGSRTQQVLARATSPVLAVRHAKYGGGRGIGRIVLALDGSTDCSNAVRACVEIAPPASAQVAVIDFGKRNGRWLSAVSARLAKHGMTPTWRHARNDFHATDEIVAAASDFRADLLVIGPTPRRGRTLLARDVMTRLLQSCPCPLLVAPAAELAKSRRVLPAGPDSCGRQETN
jgi:nucleotide-binding universal stress UspA family protein